MATETLTATAETAPIVTLPAQVKVNGGDALGTTCTLFAEGESREYGDFRDDIIRDGFAVVKGAVPRDRANDYADRMHQWLEDLYVAVSALSIAPRRSTWH